MLRSQAVSFLEDQAVLTKVALEDEHDIVRRSAVANLTDQGTLAKIAVEDHDEDVRYAAAGKIQDMSVLSNVAKNEKNKDTEMYIIVELRKVMTESGVLQGPMRIVLSVSRQYAPYRDEQKGIIKEVVGQLINLSVIGVGGSVLLSTTQEPNFPGSLSADWPSGVPVPQFSFNMTDLLASLCLSEHFSASQIRQAMINIAVRDRDGWYDAMSRLKKENYSSTGTALHAVADIGDKDMAALLLANGADVNTRNDFYGSTPLHGAANAKDSNGWTPLHVAAHWHNRDVAEVLLANGADVNAKTKDGQTPLYLAEHVNNPAASAVVELLREHGGHE
jgi:hypothetical protein